MPDLNQALTKLRASEGDGPVALVFVEDEVLVDETLEHLQKQGFEATIVFGRSALAGEAADRAGAEHVEWDVHDAGAVPLAVNKVIPAFPGRWMHYCYNAEFLFFPYSETRKVSEMLAFHTEERRTAMLTTVVDLYADDLTRWPDGVAMDGAMLDTRGYYSFTRYRDRASAPMERQIDIFGGLRWRFEEHVPLRSRRLDRIGLFQAGKGVELREDHTFSVEEMNTTSCPWHHNLTAAIASFRAAKALRSNPGSRAQIDNFQWEGSAHFDWSSQQLMDLGFIEPGQWF